MRNQKLFLEKNNQLYLQGLGSLYTTVLRSLSQKFTLRNSTLTNLC